MAADTEPTTAGGRRQECRGSPSVVLDDVHVTYRIYEDRRPTLAKLARGGFRRRSSRSIHAVRGVSLIAYPGEAIGVIGHNGSGKSTLLRTIAGLLPPDRGTVLARSTPILLGVKAALDGRLSGRRNIYLGGTAIGLSRKELTRRFDDIVAFAGVGDFIDMPLRAYSSGMAARLQFAIASVVTPDVLLVDEALAVGDAAFRRKSEARIAEMLDDAGTVFIVSHGLASVVKVCSRALWLHKGRLRADGPAEEVVQAYQEAADPGARARAQAAAAARKGPDARGGLDD